MCILADNVIDWINSCDVLYRLNVRAEDWKRNGTKYPQHISEIWAYQPKKEESEQKKNAMDTDESTEEENESRNTEKVLEDILKEWNLGHCLNILCTNGFDQLDDWKYITFEDLMDIGFKLGHSRRFLRKRNEYFGFQ